MSAHRKALPLARELGRPYHHVRVAQNVLHNLGGYTYDEGERIVRVLAADGGEVLAAMYGVYNGGRRKPT